MARTAKMALTVDQVKMVKLGKMEHLDNQDQQAQQDQQALPGQVDQGQILVKEFLELVLAI
jgi:hypothetical protein